LVDSALLARGLDRVVFSLRDVEGVVGRAGSAVLAMTGPGADKDGMVSLIQVQHDQAQVGEALPGATMAATPLVGIMPTT
jgi:hypothetical protein